MGGYEMNKCPLASSDFIHFIQKFPTQFWNNNTYQQLLLESLAYLVNSTIEVQINKGEKP